LIDLHNHILPGVDDGATTLADALAMARVARADGITTVVATPHRSPWAYRADRADAERRLAEVATACVAEGIDLQLVLGSEAFVAPDLPEQVRTGLALTINAGHYLLVEWPYDQYPPYSEPVLFELQVRGLHPVMAHAERYRVVQREPERLARLIERGLIVQVTASSLLGDAGPAIQRTAETLLQQGLAHLLATDSHSVAHRPPLLSLARERARVLVGDERAWALVRDVPAAIVADRPLSLPAPEPRKPRAFWALWK
jgi:protein-tyrosine phosphatase